MRVNVNLLSLAIAAQSASGLSTVAHTKEVVFPIKTGQSKDLQVRNVKYAFQEIVESTEFFVQNSPAQFHDSSCLVPAMGAETALRFQQNSPSSMFPHWSTEFVLKVNTNANSDFGRICAKILEQEKLLEDFVDTSSLRKAVEDHYNSLHPHSGVLASSDLSNSLQLDDLFGGQAFCMDEYQPYKNERL
ncbi:MAG: hypothetical protein SGBAC_007786 [Bacillariaceae sp.]